MRTWVDAMGDNLEELLSRGHLRPVAIRATVATNDADPLILDEDQVRVRSFELREAVSEPCELVLTLCTDDVGLDLDLLVGGACDLEVERPGHGGRTVCGVIEQVDYVQTVRRRLVFRLHVVPAIALLRHSRRRRIFQDQSVVEIVRAVCGPVLERYSRELIDDRLIREYPPRDYCVQMDETEVQSIRNLGKIATKELKKKLADRGLSFGMRLTQKATT